MTQDGAGQNERMQRAADDLMSEHPRLRAGRGIR